MYMQYEKCIFVVDYCDFVVDFAIFAILLYLCMQV